MECEVYNAGMDLGCAIRVRVRKSLWITILRTRFSVADFGGSIKKCLRKIAYANRVTYVKSSRTRCDLGMQFEFCVPNSIFAGCDFTGCNLRRRFAYAICVLDSKFAHLTRFCVLDSNIYAIIRTKLGANCVRDLHRRFDFAYAICVCNSNFRALL